MGWRPEIALWVAASDPPFCEVIAESLAPADPSRGVAELRERGVPVVPHGVRLFLGGAEPVDAGRVAHLAACAPALSAPLVSEAAVGREPGSLAERQAALVAALVANGPLPARFDPDRLAATRRALLRKRAAAAAREWPLLAASFGAAWPRVFAEHRAGHEPVGALRDGWDIALALRERGRLAMGSAGELAGREARMQYDGRSAPRRRSPAERASAALQRRLRPGRG